MKQVFIFVFFFVLGISAALAYHLSGSSPVLHSPISFITNKKEYPAFSIVEAPSQALKANISNVTGDIQFESRVATKPAALGDQKTITQGERIIANENASAVLTFTDILSVRVSKNTELSVIQTLPSSLVFAQPSGTAEYVSTGKSPVSVRTHNVAVLMKDGSLVIDVDQETGYITFTLSKGKATLAYNDSDNESTVVTIDEKQSYIFDDASRTGRIEN